MRVRLTHVAAVVAVSSALAFAASERGAASATVNGKKVSIDYGRPALKGRALGDLISKLSEDRVWRSGDDQVTTLTTETDLLIGGKTVKAGKYSVYVHLPVDGSRNLILNTDLGQPLVTIFAAAPENLKNAPWPYIGNYQAKIGGQGSRARALEEGDGQGPGGRVHRRPRAAPATAPSSSCRGGTRAGPSTSRPPSRRSLAGSGDAPRSRPAPPQRTRVSLCSPKTARRRPAISPTVAQALTASMRAGTRLAPDRARSSTASRAARHGPAGRRARRARTRSTWSRSTLGVDPQGLDARRLARVLKSVHADDDALPGLHLALEAVGRLLDLALDLPALDGPERSPARLDGVQEAERLGLEGIGRGLDGVRAAQGIGRVGRRPSRGR